MTTLSPVLQAVRCPACGGRYAAEFLRPDEQPLATIAWPSTAEEAQDMRLLPVRFVQCVSCTHVFNRSFSYDDVPYSEKPNRMFNQAAAWSGFVAGQAGEIARRLGDGAKTIVEIGYGDGSFLSTLAALLPQARLIGFDPNGAPSPESRIETHAALFDPGRHIAEFKPDMIVSRHVLEHIDDAIGFLEEISLQASLADREIETYFEVPCIDTAIAARRTVDFYYEHPSQFTTRSFATMLRLAAPEGSAALIGHGYDGEVVFAFTRLGGDDPRVAVAQDAEAFAEGVERGENQIVEALNGLIAAGNRVAVWGGTGKSAAFLNRYDLDRVRFPVVVDSDIGKVGTFVPGTGQEIRFRDHLLTDPHDVILIPPQWRAADIVREMRSFGIKAEVILIEHNGKLVDFLTGDHPYARPM